MWSPSQGSPSLVFNANEKKGSEFARGLSGCEVVISSALSKSNFIAKIISLLTPVLVLAFGLPLMVVTTELTPSPEIACVTILLTFIAYNLLCGLLTNIKDRLMTKWSLRKSWHFFLGLLIGAGPIGLAYLEMFYQKSLPPYQGITILMGALTLFTVAWEELWFRGVALELAETRYSKFGAAVIFGLIFALLHLMNPKIDLLHDGLQLALAGYTLSVCYFAFGSIWAPIGIHFANNGIQAIFGQSSEPRTLVYFGSLTLVALIFTFFMFKSRED